MTFAVITIGLYSLVLFTPGSNAPKLGIDLQGGTRITLTAQTTDQSAPTRQSMLLARDIMERRVNGSGVAGAQVQIDGTQQLVVTVPGTEDLTNLTRSAQLNLRPVITGIPQAALVTSSSADIGGTTTETTPPTAAPSSASGAEASSAPTSQGWRSGYSARAPGDPTATDSSSPADTMPTPRSTRQSPSRPPPGRTHRRAPQPPPRRSRPVAAVPTPPSRRRVPSRTGLRGNQISKPP